MIGPRGVGVTELDALRPWVKIGACPDTFWNPAVENKQENPPRLFDPKGADERFSDVQKRTKRQRQRFKTPKVMNRSKRQFLALALLSGELGEDSGAAVRWTLRHFVDDEK